MDYVRTAVALAALAAAGGHMSDLIAAPSQGLSISGQLMVGVDADRELAVRFRCPGYLTETLASASGYFTVRMPRPSIFPPTDPGFSSRRPEDTVFPDSQLLGSTDCTLEILERGSLVQRVELTVPNRSGEIYVGEVELPSETVSPSGNRLTIPLSALAAPQEGSIACKEARRELAQNRPDLDRTRRLLETTLQLHPRTPEAWALLGVVEDAGGHPDAARSDFERAVELDAGSPEAHTFLAQLDLREQKWEEALAHCNLALESEPTYIRAHYLRAFAAFNVGDFETARAACSQMRARPTEARFADIVVVEALLLAQEGKASEAATLVRSFLKQNPGYSHRSALEHQLEAWYESRSLPGSPDQDR